MNTSETATFTGWVGADHLMGEAKQLEADLDAAFRTVEKVVARVPGWYGRAVDLRERGLAEVKALPLDHEDHVDDVIAHVIDTVTGLSALHDVLESYSRLMSPDRLFACPPQPCVDGVEEATR